MKLLIIEDEKRLSSSITSYLSKENFLCEVAYTASQADELLCLYEYDCIVLDITLPDGNGLSILESIRKQNREEGIIIVSAKHSLDDRLKGLDLGADDYLMKPFHMAELRSRLLAVIRRRHFSGNNRISLHEIDIDLHAKSISVYGKLIEATRKEFDLFLFLTANRNKVVSKSSIAEHISGDNAQLFNNFDFVYTHMKNLKKKLSDAGCRDYIKTVHGLGYKLEA
ncbi:response regulator transcription factor [Xanthocytophaga flava]|uniref:response regulator transcription factor n=1 Tax=Xanthocytophaga flava TaxID=3048013 RepID=UPI0028D0F744|nr:response regulator transcription factor [Xanthocytophaga flavus]MDJ1470331.1 response regulator transcription factor [Xanthocytophaga flavus]